MAGNDGFLYPVPSDTDPNDGRLRDPTVADAGGGITVSGALNSGSPVIAGALVSSSTVTGALAAGSSTTSGLVSVSGVGTVIFSGALVAQAATVSGALVGSSQVTGALLAQASAITGVLTSGSEVSGALAAQASVASGSTTVNWLLHSPDVYLLENGGDKYLQEDVSGFYRREEIALSAQASTMSGTIEISGGVAIVIGGKGDNDGRRRRGKTLHLPFKPTGIVDRPRADIEQRVAESRDIAAEVAGKLAKEFSQDNEARPEHVSLSAIDTEIGELLREEVQSQDMEVILMLLAACVESRAI